jgi:hypothetical protein
MLQAPGLSLLVPIASLLLLPSEAGASWLAAIRTVDVSPTPEHLSTDDVFLGGYGALGFRDGLTLGYARGVADPIMARALYVQEVVGEAAAGVEQRQSAFVLVVLDAVGVGNRIRDEIRERVTAAVVGLEPERVLVASTHTHCGPDLQGMWGGINDRYRAAVVAGAADAAIFAHGNASRVDLAVSSAETDGALSRNRRGWDFVSMAIFSPSCRCGKGDPCPRVKLWWGSCADDQLHRGAFPPGRGNRCAHGSAG